MGSPSKVLLSDYLTEHGLVVEGDESHDELHEAYRYMRAAGYPVLAREAA